MLRVVSGWGSDRRTVLALSVALGAALLVIAFLLGRDSVRTVPGNAILEEAARPAGLEPDPGERSTEKASRRRWPAWADLTDEEPSELRAAEAGRGVVERTEAHPTDRFALTPSSSRPQTGTRQDAPAASPANPQGRSVGSYFQEVDLIRSEEGAGDPNAFAMDLIKGGLGGATSGFDQLIDDTRVMEQEMRGVTPPASCENYHEASIKALVESREMIERMKRAIVGRDIGELNAIAFQSKALQRKAQALKEMRQGILAEQGAN